MAKVKNKDKSNNIKFFIIAIFVAAVIAVLAVLGVGYYHDANNTETMSPGNVALVVGDTEISVGEYNYYYTLISNDFINSADEYGIDTTKDYSLQTTTDDNGKKLKEQAIIAFYLSCKCLLYGFQTIVKQSLKVSVSYIGYDLPKRESCLFFCQHVHLVKSVFVKSQIRLIDI